MALGLTSKQIEKILDLDKLEDIIGGYEREIESNPQLTGAFGLRELIIELIIKNNKRIERQLSSSGIIIS